MRTLTLAIVGLIATCAFCFFFVLHSVMSYASNPARVIETARDGDLHALTVRVAEEVVAQDARRGRNPLLLAFVRKKSRALFGEVFDKQWFYASAGAVYRDLVPLLEGERSTRENPLTAIDLRDRKERLRQGLLAMAAEIDEKCLDLFPPSLCENEDKRDRIKAGFQRGVARAMKEIPAEFRLDDALKRAGSSWLEPNSRAQREIRRWAGRAQVARHATLAAVVLCLLVVAMISRSPITRLLATVGGLLAVASSLYLIAVYIAGSAVADFLVKTELADPTELRPNPGAVRDAGLHAAETIGAAAARDALHSSNATVFAILAAAVAAIVVSISLRRRTGGGVTE